MKEYRVKVKVLLRDPRMAHISKEEIADVLMELYMKDVYDASFEGAGKGTPIRLLVVSEQRPSTLAEMLGEYSSIGVQDSTYDAEIVSIDLVGEAEV